MRVVIFIILFAVAGIALAQDINNAQRKQKAAQDLVRNVIGPGLFDQGYKQTAEKMALEAQLDAQKNLKREITEGEKQRLQLFFIGKLKELMPYSAIETILVSVVMKNLTINDLDQANKFYASETGRKLVSLTMVMTQEAAKAGSEAASKMTTPEWINKTVTDLNQQFPGWFKPSE